MDIFNSFFGGGGGGNRQKKTQVRARALHACRGDRAVEGPRGKEKDRAKREETVRALSVRAPLVE